MNVVIDVVVAVAGVDVIILAPEGVQFEEPQLDVYMYSLTLPLPSFGQQSAILCHNWLNFAFWCSKMLLCHFSNSVNEGLALLKVTLSKNLAS